MLYFGGMVILPEHYLKDFDGTAYLEEYNFKMLPGTGPYLIKMKISLTKNHILWLGEMIGGVRSSNKQVYV